MQNIILIFIGALAIFVVYNLFNSKSKIVQNKASDSNNGYKNRVSNKTNYNNHQPLYYVHNNEHDNIEEKYFWDDDDDVLDHTENDYQNDFNDEEYYEYMDAEYEYYERED